MHHMLRRENYDSMRNYRVHGTSGNITQVHVDARVTRRILAAKPGVRPRTLSRYYPNGRRAEPARRDWDPAEYPVSSRSAGQESTPLAGWNWRTAGPKQRSTGALERFTTCFVLQKSTGTCVLCAKDVLLNTMRTTPFITTQ